MKRGTSYEFRGGLRFFERAHIKDVAAHLRIIANPRDEAAWLRTLSLYPGIGAATAGKIIEQARQFPSLKDALSSSGINPSRAASGWELCGGVLRHMLSLQHPAEMIRAVIARGYRDYLEAEQPDFRDRLDDLEQFATFAETASDLTSFLEGVTLAENFGGRQNEAGEKIILSTIHQAKGLEWDVVFVIGLRDGSFPNPHALAEGEVEEERRLFYVATTRAREKLYLTYSLSDGRGGSSYGSEWNSASGPSMFLSELPRGVVESSPSPRGGGVRGEGLNGRWRGEDYEEPTIVLDDNGEKIKKSKLPPISFLRDINEL